jgi:hypothetical protein
MAGENVSKSAEACKKIHQAGTTAIEAGTNAGPGPYWANCGNAEQSE